MKQPFEIKTGWPEDAGGVARFLDRNFDFDRMTTGLLEEKLFEDPMADPGLCFSAYRNEALVGFLYAVRRDIRGEAFGYVKLMAVDQAYRRKGIGTALYQAAEESLVAKGATKIRIYDVPLNYFMPGIDPRYTPALCMAWKLGFKQFGESVNMVTDLAASDWSTKKEEQMLLAKGIEVRRATKEDKKELFSLLAEEWLLWQNEAGMALKNDPPSAHIALKNGRIKAFSLHNANNKGTGWFGPMGTHADLRGLGMGSLLLKRCLKDMQEEGHRTAIIPWVAPVAFYAHYVGARVERVFWRNEKEVLLGK